MKRLLQVRKEIKKHKPKFIQQDAHKKARLQKKWRRPRGNDSKMRKNLRGYRKSVASGYKSPKAVRGLNRNGKKLAVIENLSQLDGLKEEDVILSSTLGQRKKLEIVKKVQELGLVIVNLKDPEKYVSDIEKKLLKKKEKKEKEEKEKKEKEEKEKKEIAKKKEEKKTLDDALDAEAKKEKEKKEKDKLLIKKKV